MLGKRGGFPGVALWGEERGGERGGLGRGGLITPFRLRLRMRFFQDALDATLLLGRSR